MVIKWSQNGHKIDLPTVKFGEKKIAQNWPKMAKKGTQKKLIVRTTTL